MSMPEGSQRTPSIDSSSIREILGESSAQLIDHIARRAQAQNLALFLVGGVVRDLLLKRRNLDLDFVLESDATRFAKNLAAECGGRIQAHHAFGTATLTLDPTVAKRLSLPSADIPDHLDFARARTETYASPAALPTVSPSRIELDLWRRDFSLNALALQLSPGHAAGRLLDVCGGLRDLEQRRVRVLHDNSFVDDPTRILRALRFARRFGFELEAKTADLMRDALPLLARVTGARLCNEIELILQEAGAAEILLRLQDMNALRSIHPAFHVSPQVQQHEDMLRETSPPWVEHTIDHMALRWNLLLADCGASDARAVCQRLDLTQALTRSVVASATLVAKSTRLSDAGSRPSKIARLLDGMPEVTLLAAWIALSHSPEAQRNIDAYASRWRHQRPGITGNDLARMGITPGPRFKVILDALRSAWIDGDIKSPEEEALLLKELLSQYD